jgi:cobalt-zinc-cadmium efflux system membrane fusion protein
LLTPRAMRPRLWSAAAVLFLPVLAGCRHGEPPTANAAEGDKPAPGEVWLSADRVREAKIDSSVVAERSIDDAVVTTGRVTFDDVKVAHIYSPVTGRVGTVDAALGQRVKRGQALATITSPDVGQASSDLHKADADLIAAQHDFDRKKDLLSVKACTAAEYEQAEDTFRSAKAERARAEMKAKLFRSGGDLVSQGYALTSPIEGEVIARNLHPGVEVQGQYGNGSAVELFTVGELDKVWIMADVYESDLARVQVGAKVVVSVVAYPGKAFVGSVDWVSGTLDPVTRTARVRCTFENPDKLLKPEMYAQARITASDEKKAVAVPRDAVVHMGEQSVVFVQVGAAPGNRVRFERLPVAVDETVQGDFVPVEHGLEAGTRVVTHGAPALANVQGAE